MAAMKHYLLMIALVALGLCLPVFTSCQSPSSAKESAKKKAASQKESDVEKEAKYGFKYDPGVGWKYIPPPATDIKYWSPLILSEHAKKALVEGRLDDAIFAARYYIQRNRDGNFLPPMRLIVAEVYEKKGLKDDALKAYQQLLSLHPGYEKAGEIKRRMQKIRSSR